MLEPGEVIDGKYRIVRRLGEGGMGAVFEAQSIRLNRRVAIKVMHAMIAQQRKLVLRFEREAQAAANIGSIHVVDVFDLGDLPSGDRYMVMEFLDGESLQARLDARSPLSPHAIAPIVIQLLEGLKKVHQSGIIHRDLKPANIFLTRGDDGEDFVKILDFGVCKMTDTGGAHSDVSTGVGAVLGSLAYMSPEQVEHGSKDLDGRADLYAVGVILYRSVTGKLPYGASTVIDLLRQLREGRAPRVEALAAGIDPQFSAIVNRALEWDRAARFATAKELQKALVDWLKSAAHIEEVLSDFLEPPAKTERAPVVLGKVALGASKRASRDTIRTDEPLEAALAEEPPTKPKRSRSQTMKMIDAPPQPDASARGPDIEIDVDLDDE